ncbi:MAG: toll/interleukin-1 receptor domain-containing protein [Clostridia bacterium]|nr:toll/interleukin-1 receptor domain-containing protein [Clostridia bacterium]
MISYAGLEEYAFVSYAHKDSDTVTEIISRLSAKGARIWYDENLVPTDEYVEVIAEKIEKSSFFIAFISKSSLASKFCRDEIRFAYETSKPMMVVYLDDEEPSAGIKMMIGGVQAIKRQENTKDYTDKIFENLRKSVINIDGVVIKNTENYTFYYNEFTNGECRFTVSRAKRGSEEREVVAQSSFPRCSDIWGYQVISTYNRQNSFTLRITVYWDFTYVASYNDFMETYEYIFSNIDAPECTYTKRTVEKHTFDPDVITTYDYVAGVSTDTDLEGNILRIHGLDKFGNYWNITGKKD